MSSVLRAMRGYIQSKEKMIIEIRNLFEKTPDPLEKRNRLEVFDTLLLLATTAHSTELEDEFAKSLPLHKPNNTLANMCEQLREINGFCTGSFSDDHELYQQLFNKIKFPDAGKKQNIRNLLSVELCQMIFSLTNSEIKSMNLGR